ncbi:hypothetical protein ACF09H_40770 [Streptomyces sp. NPDC014983]|uniref:hypothetical protein n=1 Tax=Streptomyces sp. NPDC014983 TaxID=3364933 RepID=UPI0036FC25B1
MEDGPMYPGRVLAAPVDLGGTGYYIHWGVLQISAANAVVIVLMLVVFALALLLPFPRGRQRR